VSRSHAEVLWNLRFAKARDLARALTRIHYNLGALEAARETRDLSDPERGAANATYWAGMCQVAGRELKVPSQTTVDLVIELLELIDDPTGDKERSRGDAKATGSS
jgi:hypothetical protein